MADIRLHPGQSKVYKDLFIDRSCRFSAVCASRGWGKSYFASAAASTAVHELLRLPQRVPNKKVAIIAPTYSQVTDIYFPMLAYEFGLADVASKYSKDLGRFWFPNDVELQLNSYEAVERMRGLGFYFVVMDEVSSWTKGMGLKEAWQSVIQPCITTRWSEKRVMQLKKEYAAMRDHNTSPGRALVISTPKGYNHFYDMYNYEQQDDLWKSYHYDYHSSPFLDEKEIERIRHTVDPIEFNSEYLAKFEDSGLRVFHNFNRKTHVRKDLEDLKEEEDAHICIDFNVMLQCSSVFAKR